jgi:hypothetical protein
MLQGEWVKSESQRIRRRHHRALTELVLKWPPGDSPQLLETKRDRHGDKRNHSSKKIELALAIIAEDRV